jgi:two-component system, chemotaxis family, protein-glutamate methylesterase/glutaminase
VQDNNFFIAGIGASAGGLEPLEKLFTHVPENPGICFVIIQHLPKDSTTRLDKIISRCTPLPAEILSKDTPALINHIYILPGNLRVTIKDGILIVRPRTEKEIINMAINEFFISLAKERRQKSIGVILAGMNDDGADGVKAISENGGIVLVQDPSTTTNNVMPFAAIHADHPNEVLGPEQLGSWLVEMAVKHSC